MVILTTMTLKKRKMVSLEILETTNLQLVSNFPITITVTAVDNELCTLIHNKPQKTLTMKY